jgi:hypothetical protein
MQLTMFVTAIVLGSCAVADAQSSRQAVSRCRPQSAADREAFNNQGYFIANMSFTRRISVICPSLDTSVHPNGQVSEILVSVRDLSETEGFSVRVCRTAREGVDHACSAWVSSGAAFTGFTELTLSPGGIWSSNDFGYLEVVMPRIYDGFDVSTWLGWVARH